MENNESSNSINEDKDKLSRKFLKIKNVRVFSNGFNLRIKENDIILGLNGEYFNSSYEDLKKALDENEEKKIVIHHVEGSPLMPGWVGGDNVRFYEFEGDLLRLSLKNAEGRTTATLTWRRL